MNFETPGGFVVTEVHHFAMFSFGLAVSVTAVNEHGDTVIGWYRTSDLMIAPNSGRRESAP